MNNFRLEPTPNRGRCQTEEMSEDDDGVSFLQDSDEEEDGVQEQQGVTFLQKRRNWQATQAKAKTLPHTTTSRHWSLPIPAPSNKAKDKTKEIQ